MIIFDNIKKIVNDIVLYDGLSFVVPDNSFYVVNCRDGEGKTTLARIIKKITKIDSGNIKYENIEKTNISIVYDNVEKETFFRVDEYIRFYATLAGVRQDLINEKIDYYLGKYNLLHLKYAEFDALDRSTRKIITVLTAIIKCKKVIVFDSPYTNMGDKERNIFKNILKNESSDFSIIILTDNIDDFVEFATDIAIIEKGRCIINGKKDYVLKEYGYKSYLEIEIKDESESAINLLKGINNVKEFMYDKNKLYIDTFTIDRDYEILKLLVDNNIIVSSFRREIKKWLIILKFYVRGK